MGWIIPGWLWYKDIQKRWHMRGVLVHEQYSWGGEMLFQGWEEVAKA